jgi:pilus assembly protein CpaE
LILRIPIAAFLLSEESVAAVEAMKEDRVFLRSRIETHEGGIDRALAYLAENKTPPLLIVESKAQGDALFDQLGGLADVCAPDTFVLLIGAENDIALYRNLIGLGISDYLVGPVTVDALKNSIVNIFKDEDMERSGRVIAFFGVAGGVGSSVIAHNVAYELTKAYEEDAIVVDMDIFCGTAALNFNMQPRQTIADVFANINRLDESLLHQYLMEFDDRTSVLASPASLSAGIQFTAESYAAIIKVVKVMAEFIILDIPHIWEPWVREALTEADDMVLVTRPDLTNLRNAKNMIEFMGAVRGSDVPTRLVFNQVGAAKKADLSGKDFKDALALEPALSIPYDPDGFGKALNTGALMSKASAKSKATAAIIELAKLISAREKGEGEEEEKGKKGLMNLFKKSKKKK